MSGLNSCAEGHPKLLSLVVAYEEASRHLKAEMDRLDEAGIISDARSGEAMMTCGRYRAEIAAFPVSCLADILLKVRAFAVSADADEEAASLRDFIESYDGHAYAEHLGQGVMIDLMRLGGTPCA